MRETKRQIKQAYITDLLKKYNKPVKIDEKKSYQPTPQDLRDYQAELEKLSIKELKKINFAVVPKQKTPLTFLPGKLSRKNSMMITIHKINNVREHYLLSKYSRFAIIKNRAYVIVPNCATTDALYKVSLLEYFENNPLPIIYDDDKPASIPDTNYLKEALHFEYAAKLAKIMELMGKVNLGVVFSVLAFIMSLVSAILAGVIAHHLNIF